MPLTQDGPYAEMLLYSLGIIQENDGRGSALVSHLKFTCTPLCKNIADPWTTTLLTKTWISLGSTDGKYRQSFMQGTAFEKECPKSLLKVDTSLC